MSRQIENIDQMRERHKREIDKLQKACKHKKLSKWMEEQWAPAHGTGSMVKVCNFCGEVVKRKGLKLELCKIKTKTDSNAQHLPFIENTGVQDDRS